MLAAVRDSPIYLASTMFAAKITPQHRAILKNTGAVIADHPDPMYDPKQNPDRPHYNVTRTPVFVITGSRDLRFPKVSCLSIFYGPLTCTVHALSINLPSTLHAPTVPCALSMHSAQRVGSFGL